MMFVTYYVLSLLYTCYWFVREHNVLTMSDLLMSLICGVILAPIGLLIDFVNILGELLEKFSNIIIYEKD